MRWKRQSQGYQEQDNCVDVVIVNNNSELDKLSSLRIDLKEHNTFMSIINDQTNKFWNYN